MALYTQNSTGFLCEFATNPGLGYTAVSSQPTDTLANRVSWWRDRDKGNLTSTWHPSEQQTGEDPGSNVLYMAFSQESGIVSSDAAGVVTDGYLGAVTQIRIMRGVNNVTQSEGWTLGFTAVDATYTTSGTDVVTLQFTSIPTDKTGGYVNVIATRTGSTTLSKTFRVLKVIRGLDGEDGVDGLRGSRQIVVDGTSWSDAAAWNGIVSQTGTTPVLSDLVTIANAGAGFSASKFYTGGAYDGDWVTPNSYINGNLLVTGTVGANKLVAGSITTTQLSFVPVTSTNVVSSINATAEGIRISGSRINIDGTVSFGAGYDPTGKIASGGAAADVNANITTISGGKITANSITANQIQTGTITAASGIIANAAITTAKIDDLQVTTAKIDNLSVNSFKIADAAITTAKIDDLQVTTAKIANLSITTAKIDDLQVTNAKIASLSVEKLDTGTLTSKTIYLNGGSIQSSNWSSGSVGWRIDGTGNADFNTVMVRTKNIAGDAATKVISAQAGGVSSGTFASIYPYSISAITYPYYSQSVISAPSDGQRGKLLAQVILSLYDASTNPSSESRYQVTIQSSIGGTITSEMSTVVTLGNAIGNPFAQTTLAIVEQSYNTNQQVYFFLYVQALYSTSADVKYAYTYSNIESKR